MPASRSVRAKQWKLKATYHAETLQSPGARKRTEALYFRGPEARHRKTECGREVYGTFTDLNGEGIANKAGSCDGDDTRAVASKRESLEWHIELLRKRHKCWGEQGADGYDRLALTFTRGSPLRTPYASASVGDDHREKLLLPPGPVVRIVRRV